MGSEVGHNFHFERFYSNFLLQVSQMLSLMAGIQSQIQELVTLSTTTKKK